MREPTVGTLLGSERELIRVRDKARARAAELEAALREIRDALDDQSLTGMECCDVIADVVQGVTKGQDLD